ncbi:MAG: MFS transporter, partial [Fimbriimonadales bacterium]
MAAPDRLDNLRALKTANVDMVLATAFATLVGGNFQQAFALEMGATPRMLALLASLPVVLGVMQLPGSILGERFASYKRFVSVGGLFWRLAWIPIVFAPVFFPSLSLLIAAIVISAIANFLVSATYTAWLSFLVPDSHRGYYFSRRIGLATITGAAVGFPASVFLDWMDRSGEFALGLSILFGIGVVCGLISYAVYWRMPDTRHAVVQNKSFKADLTGITAPLRDKNFVRLLIFLVVFVIGQTLAAPFFFPYGREVLKLDFVYFQVFGGFHAAASLLSAPMWGYFSDKYGNKPVLFASGLLISLGPITWVLCDPSLGNWNLPILMIGHAISGFSWTGVAVAQGNIILANSSPALRSAAIALSQAVIAIVGFGGQMIGGEIMQRTLGMMTSEARYQMLFLLNSGMRVVAVGFLVLVRDPTSSSVRGFLRQIANIRPRGVIAMRRLGTTGDIDKKERAIRDLAVSRMTMAESELTALLIDPSPRLRREAAEALGRIGGPEASVALQRLIEEQPLLVEDEMVEALALIGDASAVPSLVSLLENPSSSLRRASAKALGRLRSPDALDALMEAAAAKDPELRRAAIQALRLIGDRRCAEVVGNALIDPYPSVRVAAAEASADLGLEETAPMLRMLLNQADEAVGEIAYALATVGSREDIQAILAASGGLVTDVARRRSLLAVGRLLGCEERLYKLFVADAVTRDTALLDWAGTNQSRRRALTLYHAGEDEKALERLARSDSRLLLLAENSQPDAFLV